MPAIEHLDTTPRTLYHSDAPAATTLDSRAHLDSVGRVWGGGIRTGRRTGGSTHTGYTPTYGVRREQGVDPRPQIRNRLRPVPGARAQRLLQPEHGAKAVCRQPRGARRLKRSALVVHEQTAIWRDAGVGGQACV
jgi:hypothetical protein